MSSAQQYRRWLLLCKNWGVDSSKSGRDLGEHIRKEVGIAFRDGEMTRSPGGRSLAECEERLVSLERIANNKFYRMTDAELPTASGGTQEELQMMVSNEGLEVAKMMYEQKTIDILKEALSFQYSRLIGKLQKEETDKSKTQK